MYDTDKGGTLDKEETKKFVQDTMGNLGSGDRFDEEAFLVLFDEFDEDKSGTIDKVEMVQLIQKLLGD